jgi:hypothetical protein
MEGWTMFTQVEVVTLDSYGREARTVIEGSLPDIVAGILAADPGSLLSACYVR